MDYDCQFSPNHTGAHISATVLTSLVGRQKASRTSGKSSMAIAPTSCQEIPRVFLAKNTYRFD